MKVIVAGGRNMQIQDVFCALEYSPFEIDELIEGEAYGVDRYSAAWAREQGVAVKPYPADWDGYGKSAGYHRNVAMAEVAEAAILVWDGESRGTSMMLEICARRGIPYCEYGPKPAERDVEYGGTNDYSD